MMSDCGIKPLYSCINAFMLRLCRSRSMREWRLQWQSPITATILPSFYFSLLVPVSSTGWLYVMDDWWRQNRPSFTAASTAPTHGHLSSVDGCTVWSRPERLGGPATDGHGPSRKNTFVCSEKHDSGGWERRAGWRRKGTGGDMHQARTTALLIQGNLLE